MKRWILAAVSAVLLCLILWLLCDRTREELNAIGTAVLGVAVLLGLLFLLLYGILARWWESREGWYLFASSVILAAILGFNYAAIQGWFLLTDPLVREWTRLVIYAGALLIMLWRGVLLIMAQAESWRVRKAVQFDTEGVKDVDQ